MSEQYPLLCEELPEEEALSPHYRRVLMSRTRAKNRVNGAAAIITRWPGQWTTLLTFWWIGIGMLVLTTYLLYTCIYVYTTHSYKLHPTPIRRPESLRNLTPSTSPSFKVFMHVFADEKQEVNLENYLPYIDILTNKFKQYKFELIIVNSVETIQLSDQENNQLAFNMLWDYNSVNKRVNNDNFVVKYVTFSKYFYDSPLKEHWMKLPQQLKKFLVRAVSIWQKGGIAFDPIILTPQSPNSNYIEKIYNILKKYKFINTKVSPKPYRSNKKPNKPSKVLPNNIRDIIKALDEGSASEKYIQDPLVEVETKNVSTTYERIIRSVAETNVSAISQTVPISLRDVQNHETTAHEKKQFDSSNSKFNLLPMFLKYIFHKQTEHPDEPKQNSELSNRTDSLSKNGFKKTTNESKSMLAKDFWNNLIDESKHKPVIISAKGKCLEKADKSKIGDVIEKEDQEMFEVTIDLKGNIIATDAPCHAFIGSMFSNAATIGETETVTDFIIKELSVFCKGLLASCVGIDVILL